MDPDPRPSSQPEPGDRLSILTALCSLSFHLTEGQKVDACYPEGALDADELRAVAFHAFPDSMSFELHTHSSVRDSSFFFRIRRSASTPAQPSFLLGYAFCRQRQDERLQRGGEQRAVVVLSPLPLGAALGALCRHAGPLCLARGAEALREAYDEVAAWPPLAWGSEMTLPLGPGRVRLDLPDLSMLPADAAAAAAALQGAAGAAAALTEELDDGSGLPLGLLPGAYGRQEPACGLFSEVDAYTPLRPVLPQLWALWELLLLGRPLLVSAPAPGACSAAVAALLSLLAPFPPSADYRPYYTIHDPAFATLARGEVPGAAGAPPGLPSVLGVTNPFVLRSLAHWPNVLGTGYTAATQLDAAPAGSTDEDGGGGGGGGGGGAPASSPPAPPAPAARRAAGRLGLAGIFRRRPAGAHALLSHPVDAAWLSYTPCVREDPEVLAALVHPAPGDPPAKRRRLARLNTAMLRRHFEELTRAVLFPLLPYLSPAPPPTALCAPQDLRAPPPLPDLDPAAVLESLSSSSRGATVPDILTRRFPGPKALSQFYQRLLASPALAAWLAARRPAAELWQRQAWRAAWRAAGGAWALPGVGHTDEVAAVERYFLLEQQAAAAAARGGDGDGDGGGAAAAAAAAGELRAAFDSLPEDLRASLLLSPGRAALLQGGGPAAAPAEH